MRDHIGLLGAITALVACASFGGNGPAFAQQQSTITRFSGIVIGSNGTWTRTIIDISEPNGPGGGTIQATYNVNVNYTVGMTDVQIAAVYRNACNATLPAAPSNPNGYAAQFNNGNNKHVRLSKQAGTYNFTDARETAFPIPGITITTGLPATAEDAPAATPAGLAALAASLSAVAWWARRRRVSV